MTGALGIEMGIAAASITAIVLWLLQPVATRLNLMDVPHGRKQHDSPTPYIGGFAIMAAVFAVGATAGHAGQYAGFASGCLLLAVIGFLDDKYAVAWYWRVLVQALATLLMVYGDGVRVEQVGPLFGLADTSLGSLSVPFTVIATVGLINAVNMVDGIDGAAGSLVATALALVVGAAWYSGNMPVAQSAVLLLGAVLAFLAYNLRHPWQPRARCFLGNSGSTFLGFALAWLTFRLTQNAGHPVSPVLALWFLPIPVMDTLVLMARRLRNGNSPFAADRNHIHHLLEAAGVGPTRASLVMAMVSLACGLAAGQALRMDVPEPILLGAFGLLTVGWYALTRDRRQAIEVVATWLATGHRRADHAAVVLARSPVVEQAQSRAHEGRAEAFVHVNPYRSRRASVYSQPSAGTPALQQMLEQADRDIAESPHPQLSLQLVTAARTSPVGGRRRRPSEELSAAPGSSTIGSGAP